jgi:hypothetical protein
MKSSSFSVLSVALIFFAAAGCALRQTLSRDEIVRTAERTALQQGVRLEAYEAPRVQPAREEHSWTVYYKGKVAPGQENYRGNFFMVVVDDRSGRTHFALRRVSV